MRVATRAATLVLIAFGFSQLAWAECSAQVDPRSFLTHELSGGSAPGGARKKITVYNSSDREVRVNLNVSGPCGDRERNVPAGGSVSSSIGWGTCGFPTNNPYKCCNPAGNDWGRHCKEPDWGFVPGKWRESNVFEHKQWAVNHINWVKSNDGQKCTEMVDDGGGCCLDSQDLQVVEVSENRWQAQYEIPAGCYGKTHEPDWLED